MKSFISIVVPAYNEECNLPLLSQKIAEIMGDSYTYELIIIDDGSRDATLPLLRELHASNSSVHYLSFSRNFGHQSALKAGIDAALGDCVISMDADMQHPPELIPLMIEKWKEGFDIVHTQRRDSASAGFFKRRSSHLFYAFMNSVSDIRIEEGTADFRLLDRRVAQLISGSSEYNLFLRGFISWIGFRQIHLPYEPAPRFSGTSKYTLRKMINLAINGITSFSIKPLRIATFLGLIISILAFLYAFYAIFIYLFTTRAIAGWTSVLVSILFIGGLQLFVMGIIGEYIGKILLQSKQRPDYIIAESSRSISRC